MLFQFHFGAQSSDFQLVIPTLQSSKTRGDRTPTGVLIPNPRKGNSGSFLAIPFLFRVQNYRDLTDPHASHSLEEPATYLDWRGRSPGHIQRLVLLLTTVSVMAAVPRPWKT